MERNKIEKLLGPEWVDFMAPFMGSEAFDGILKQLKDKKAAGEVIYPEQGKIFRAFTETPLSKVRVIILGQDPYPGEGLANGLAFAHLTNMKKPSSMEQIIQAIENDAYSGLNFDSPHFNTELTQWTKQGIMLLNTALTVKEDTPGSHAVIWQPFTDYFVKTMNEVKHDVIWNAWGKQAQGFMKYVNIFTNFIIREDHPQRAAKEGGIWKPTCFSRINAIIIAQGLGEKIIW